jgi:hypothetical protein
MNPIVTFIIPVRHQDNARDWGQIKSRLAETLRSISAQDDKRWRAIVVANHGADLPELPPRVEVKRVDFPPNPAHEKEGAVREEWWDAVRFDKGRRILAGLLHAGKEAGYIMFCDDDDLVSRRLVSFAAQHPEANGWYFKQGYVWTDGGDYLYLYDGDYSRLCGTTHIVRQDLFDVPEKFEDASREYICKMLGSHIFLHDHLDTKGTPLAPLPSIGGIYRIGHVNAHSSTENLMNRFFLRSRFIFRPWMLVARLMRLRRITPELRQEFFGG